MASFLPDHEGLLPQWLLFVSVISTLNSIQSYVSSSYHQNLYVGSSATKNESPSTPLASRTFGTWTLLSSVVRMYAAYNVRNPVVYDIALWTYVIALFHFVSEWAVYGSAQFKGRFVMPVLFASSAVVWMLTQRSWYLA